MHYNYYDVAIMITNIHTHTHKTETKNRTINLANNKTCILKAS